MPFTPLPKGVVEQEPVRGFTGDHHRLNATLMQMLQTQRADFASFLAVGQGVTSYDQYRYRVGQIEGLDIAINFCKQAQEKLQG